MDSGITRPGTLVSAGALLDTWTSHDWAGGLVVDRLTALDRLTVRTVNSTYEIVIVAAAAAEVLVRGGSFFPEFTPARVAGASLGGSFLKLHGIYIGFRMEIADAGRVIITSTVQTIAVETGGGASRGVM